MPAKPGARQVDAQRFLASLPMFEALDAATLARLAASTERRPLKKGEVLFRRGDRPAGMYVVVYGDIRLLAHGRRPGGRLAGVVGAGRSFGEPVMFLDRPALVDAEAATDAVVLHLPKAAVFAEIEHDPKFARRVIASLSRRIEGLVQDMERQALGSGRERLADYLLRGGGAQAGATVTLPSSKAAMASLLRLTPEHFSRLLHELSAEGAIAVKGRSITVLDPPRLRPRPRRAGRSHPE